ncbi:MAG: PilN domain-containing protein [Myxacorys chilensis ATA2-1-KO14]|nr:PilN domain-containing protein [Myxacorys chilensis ATA2-1-KO14]
MYSLDVNFLNDRPELKPNSRRLGRSPKLVISSADKRPMYIGLAALIAFPVFAGAIYGVLAWRTGDLEQQQAALDSQLGNLEIEKKNLATIEAQAKQATDEAQALATVFNQIKPWSAMAQDIRDRLPANVQLLAIKQLEAKDQASAPAGSAKVSNTVQIEGFANSFNDVNDFLLTLQQSNFLKPEITKIVDAHLGEDRTLQTPDMPNVPFKRSGGAIKLPKQVQFSIVTAVSEVPASDLIRELDRKGAVGLVTRIEALQDRGVIQTASTQPAKSAADMKATSQDKGAKKP